MQSTQPDLFLSIVIPLYNEEESLRELLGEIKEHTATFVGQNKACEILFVDDGSTDTSWSVVESLIESESTEYFKVRGVSFQRNYGKSIALQTGFENVSGKVVITMDADLQDDPAEIPALVSMILDEGYDMVSGWKKIRHDPMSKTLPSRFFNAVTRMMTRIPLHDFNCGLKAYKGAVTKSIHVYGEMHRYVPLLAKNAGFKKIGEKVVRHRARQYGKTKFGASRFLNGFLDLLTLLFIHTYTQRPMHFFGAVGVFLIFSGAIVNLYLAYEKIVLGGSLQDRPLLFLGVLLMIVGAQFFSIGFLGEMINSGNVKREKPNIRIKL